MSGTVLAAYRYLTRLPFIGLLILVVFLTACEVEPPPPYAADQDSAHESLQHASAIEPVDERPVLRVLTVKTPLGTGEGASKTFPQTRELTLVRQFAEEQQHRLQLVTVDSLDMLLPALLEGKADLAAANLTNTPQRRKLVRFTTPVAFVKEVVVGRKNELPTDPQDLGGREVFVNPASSFQQTLQRLLRKRFQPEFAILALSEEIRTPHVLDAVARGEFDLTVIDSNVSDILLSRRDDLGVAFSLGEVKPIAWAVPPEREALLQQLNAFLTQHQLLASEDEQYREDLPALKKRHVLRLATRNNAASYFLWRGQQQGFDFELVKRFAQRHGMRLEVVVPEEGQTVLQLVRDGLADVAAASLTITPSRQSDGIVFSRHYNEISEMIVARQDGVSLQKPADLQGRKIAVRRHSSYYETLTSLQRMGIELDVELVPGSMETQTIIAKVAEGEYDLTLADSHIADIELTWRDDVRAAFAVGQKRQHGWAVRQSSPELLKAINAFWDKEYKGLHYNLAKKKYFKNRKGIQRLRRGQQVGELAGKLSPYDDLVKRFADRYGFDWRLLTSQMFQESRFDPKAKSWAGAQGLMQVLPRTGKELGLVKLQEPAVGIHAGAKYLDWLRRRFEAKLDPGNRLWFALAAYNAGIGHVRDARRLAQQKGWNANQWFGNVEKAMLLLSRKEYARKARHGYVRGREPVEYVQQIRSRFKVYVDATRPSNQPTDEIAELALLSAR